MEALIASAHRLLRSNGEGCGEPSIRAGLWRWKEALLKEEPCGNGGALAKPAFSSLPRGKESRIHVTGSVQAISAGGTALPCPCTKSLPSRSTFKVLEDDLSSSQSVFSLEYPRFPLREVGMTALSLASPIISLHICISKTVTLLLALLWGVGQIYGEGDVSAPGVGIFITHSQPESCPCL